jgi:hypothetical protein
MRKQLKRYKPGSFVPWLVLLAATLFFSVRGHSSFAPGNFIAIHMPPLAFETLAQEFSGLSFPMKFDQVDFQEMLGKIDEDRRALAQFAGLDCSGIVLNDVRGKITVESVEVKPDAGALVAHLSLNDLTVQAKLHEPDNIAEMSTFCRGTAGIFADPDGLQARHTEFSVKADIKDGSLLLETPELVGNVEVGEFVFPDNWTSRLSDKERQKPEGIKSMLLLWYPMLIDLVMREVVSEKVNITHLFPIPIPLGRGYQALLKNSPRLEKGYLGEVNNDSSVTFMFEGEITPTEDRKNSQLGDCPKPEKAPYSAFKLHAPQRVEDMVDSALPSFSNEPGSSPFQVALTASLVNHALNRLYQDRFACFEQSGPLQHVLQPLRPTTMPQDTMVGLNAHFLAPPIIGFEGLGLKDGGFGASLSARLGLHLFLEMEHRKIRMSGVDLDQLELDVDIAVDERGVNVGLAVESDNNNNRIRFSLPQNRLFTGSAINLEISTLNDLVANQVIPGLLGNSFNIIGRTTELRGGMTLTTEQASFENNFLVVGLSMQGLRDSLALKANQVALTYGVDGVDNTVDANVN